MIYHGKGFPVRLTANFSINLGDLKAVRDHTQSTQNKQTKHKTILTKNSVSCKTILQNE